MTSPHPSSSTHTPRWLWGLQTTFIWLRKLPPIPSLLSF